MRQDKDFLLAANESSKREWLCWVCLSLALLSLHCRGDERPTLTFTCLTDASQLGFRYYKEINRQVFGDMGYNFKLEHDNQSDALRRLRSGEVDGDCGRHNQFIELTGIRTLVQAQHPFRVVTFNLWQKPNISASTTRSDMSVGYNSNMLFIKTILERMKFKQLTGLVSNEQLVDRVIDGSLDATINFGTAMEPFQRKMSQNGIINKGPILSVPIYSLFQKRHEHLVGDYSQRLKMALIAKPFRPPFNARIPKKFPNEIVFSCSIPTNSQTFTRVERVYRAAFDALGFNFRMISLPRVRESAELQRQNISGSCGRAASFLTEDMPAVAVDVKVASPELNVWSRDANDQLDSLSDIPAGSLAAYVRGSTTIERNPIILNMKSVQFVGVANTAVGIRMLDALRVDYYLESKVNAANVLNSIRTRNSIYNVGEIPGERITPLLTEQWKHLAEPLEKELKAMLKQYGVEKVIDIEVI